MLDTSELLNELLLVARGLGVEVRSERFQENLGGAGGLCWLRGRRVILLNRVSSLVDRCGALAEGLGQLPTDGVVMSQAAQQAISRTRYGSALSPVRTGAKPGIVSHRAQRAPGAPQAMPHPFTAPDEHVVLGPRTTLGVGGAARYFWEARRESDISQALAWAKTQELPTQILGGGSNLVVSDRGFPGLVIQIALRGTQVTERKSTVRLSVAAGEPWDDIVAQTVRSGWQGLECLSGIPGLVGATPVQNVGAYGQEVSEVIQHVRVLDKTNGKISKLSARDCRFAYRDSLFKSVEPERFVVLAVTYQLHKGAEPNIVYAELARELADQGHKPSLDAVRSTVLTLRRRKSMVFDLDDENARSCGSFFVNPIVSAELAARIDAVSQRAVPRFRQSDGRVKLPAAWLIEQAGFKKGERQGAVGLSTRHALALVAHAGASASDVVSFARAIRARVWQTFGVALSPEPAFWGFDGPLDSGLPQ